MTVKNTTGIQAPEVDKRTLAATVPTEEQTTFLTKPKRPPDLPTRSGPSIAAHAQWPF